MSDAVKRFAILVCGPGSIERAWVIAEHTVRIAEKACIVYDFVFARAALTNFSADHDGDVLVSNEGITWCRGWDGPIANAFRTSVAL